MSSQGSGGARKQPGPGLSIWYSRRAGTVGMAVAACIALGYGAYKWAAHDDYPEHRLPESAVERPAAERVVLVGQDEAGAVRVSVARNVADRRRDALFQETFARRFELDEGAYTVWLLTIAYGTDGAPALNRNDDEPTEAESQPQHEPLPLGDERVVLWLADGREVASVPLRSFVPRTNEPARLFAAAYAGEGEVDWGRSARRYVVFPGAISLEDVAAADVTLADGRLVRATPTTESVALPPGARAADGD